MGVFAACKYIQRGDLPSFQIGQIRCAVRAIRAAHVFALNPTLIGAGHRAAVDCVDLHIAHSDFRIFFNVQFDLCTLAVCFLVSGIDDDHSSYRGIFSNRETILLIFRAGFLHIDAHAARILPFYINVLEIILLCTDYFQITCRLLSFCRNRNLDFSTQIRSCDRIWIFHNFLCISHSNNLTAMFSCPRTDIYYIIRCQHRIFIMFYYNQRISKITQMFQRRKKFIIISLMKSDTRLIQNICNSDQT